MIANALTFVTKQLNNHFKNTLELDHTMVALSRLTNPNIDGKLVLTLVDIAEDPIKANHIERIGQNDLVAAPILSLNLDFLIAVAPRTPYVEGMKILSQAIVFFKEHPVFNAAQTKMPEGIDRIRCEMRHLDTDTKNTLWQSLGANYQPSVGYKMRLVIQNEDGIKAVVPRIS